MKFRWRVFSLCIVVYLISLGAAGIVLTENSYRNLMHKEIERCLKEEQNLKSMITLYLDNSIKLSKEKIDAKKYSRTAIDMFTTSDFYIEVYDDRLNLLASNSPIKLDLEREELKYALDRKRNYILRWDGERHYVFISDSINIQNDTIVASYIKEVTDIDEQKTEQYKFFVRVGILGLVFVTIAAFLLSSILVRPIRELISTVKDVAGGNYSKRVKVSRKDEIGELALRFNTMADKIEENIEKLKGEADRKQSFIDNITHELRTPLTSIIGFSDFLMKIKYDEVEFEKGLGYINSEGKRLLKMSHSMMEMILLRRSKLTLENHSTMRLFREAAELLKSKAELKGVKLLLHGQDMQIVFDYDLILEVMLNLTDNAINACDEGGIVEFCAEAKDMQKIITIKDNGRGMHEEDAKMVVEPFYRIDKARARKDGGVGLGLSICRQILEAHSASMDIQSCLGKGTTIKIVF